MTILSHSLFFLITVLMLATQSIAQTPLPQPTQIQSPQPTQTPLPQPSQAAAVANDQRLGERDPFLPPKYIRDMELTKPEDIIDKKMEAIRRWPLSEYKLKGIIWDVKNPKAMIVDKVNTLHLVKKNYRIGNREGVISEIGDSEIVVVQKGIPTVIQIDKAPVTESVFSAPASNDLTKNINDLKNQTQQLLQINSNLQQAPEIKK